MGKGCKWRVFACFIALPLAVFSPRIHAEPAALDLDVSLRREPITELPDVYSFRKPMSACMLVLGLFKKRLPNMRQYRRLFHEFTIPTVTRPIEGTNVTKTESTYTGITPENIDLLFTHQYDADHPNRFGAKGLLYFDPDGKMRAIMWPTGTGLVGNNIHHKDAVASVIETEANGLKRVVRELEKKGDLASGVLALDLAQELRTVADNLHFNRKQDSFTEEMLHRFQGFQLTAERDKDGKLSVTKVQISSSVTSTQISRHEPLVVEELNKGLAVIRDSIAPELRSYGPVEIDGLRKMELDHPEDLGLKGEHAPIETPPTGAPVRRRPR